MLITPVLLFNPDEVILCKFSLVKNLKMEALLENNMPPKWKYAIKNDGRIFFMNDDMQSTTWAHPIWRHPVQSGHFRNTDLSEGVEYDYSDEGIAYFINHNDLSTSWLPPQHEKVEMRKNSKRSISPFKRTNSKRKSLKKKSVDVKRNRNSEVIMRGWLHRQEGGIGPLKSWKKRWCVLSDMCLFVYKGPEEGDLMSSVLLPSYKITPGQKDSADKFIFKAEHENMKSEHFAGGTVEEAEKWMEAMYLASMAVDGNFMESQDTIDNDEADKSLNLKPSTSLPQVFNDSQNLKQQPDNTPLSMDNFENKEHCEQLSGSDVKNVQYNKSFGNSRDFDLSDMKSNRYVKNVEKGHDNNPINMTGKSLHSWKDYDTPADFQPDNEIMPININDSNLSRVREWTEEQNKYRSGMMPSKSSEEVPFASPSVDSQVAESRKKWMKSEDGLNFSRHTKDSNKNNFQKHCPINSFHLNNVGSKNLQDANYCFHQSDIVTSRDAIPSRQSSKNNSEEVPYSDSREIETGKVIVSNKSSASSNLSNVIKNSVTSPITESMRQTNTISTSPESFKKVDINDLIMKHTNSLKESHNIIDVFNQSAWLSPSQKEHLVQVLIQLRRDQTALHELLYCQMTDGDVNLNNHLETIRMLIDDNSLIINQLESCLYEKSTKELTDNDKLVIQTTSLTENKVEPPKPRKRSTVQTTSPLTTPPFDSIMQMNDTEMMALHRNEPMLNQDMSYYDFEQPLTSSPNLSFSESQNYRNVPQTPEENKSFNKAGYSHFVDDYVKNKPDFIEQRSKNHPDLVSGMIKNEHRIAAIRNQEEMKPFNGKVYSPADRNKFIPQMEQKIFNTREHSPDLRTREMYTTKEKDFCSAQKLKINRNMGEYKIENQMSNRSDRNMPPHLQGNKPYNSNDQNVFAPEQNLKNNLNKYQMSTKLNMQEIPHDKKSFVRNKHLDNDNERTKQYLRQKVMNTPEAHGMTDEIESFLETDLDSLKTCNIAKFTYGVTPTDLNKSPAFKKTHEDLDLKSTHNREMKGYHYSKSQHENSRAKQIPDSSHYRPNHGELSNNNIKKDTCRPELRVTGQYKQSVVPLKSSEDCHVYNLTKRNNKIEQGSGTFHAQTDHFFSEVRQRTQSLSNDDAKGFKNNISRTIKSTQNLNKDENSEGEKHEVFRRSNIRRLSGIFTPRPFYKSRSTNEVQDAADLEVSDRQKEPFMNVEKNAPHNYGRIDEFPVQHKKELRGDSNKDIENHLREMNLRERTEDERRRRQHLLDMRFGLSHESTPRSKYGV